MNPLELARDRLLSQTSGFDREIGEADPLYLRRLREEGRSHFASLGFPTTRLEEWRYTNVGPIAATDFRLAGRKHALQSMPPKRHLRNGRNLYFPSGRISY